MAICHIILLVPIFMAIFMMYRLFRKPGKFSQFEKLIVILLILNILLFICSLVVVSFMLLLLFYDAIFDICIEVG